MRTDRYTCELCNGPARRKCRTWDMAFCDNCRYMNHDGICDFSLEQKLEATGIDFERNRNGWVDIPD